MSTYCCAKASSAESETYPPRADHSAVVVYCVEDCCISTSTVHLPTIGTSSTSCCAARRPDISAAELLQYIVSDATIAPANRLRSFEKKSPSVFISVFVRTAVERRCSTRDGGSEAP